MGVSIHGYEKKYESAIKSLHESDLSEKNRTLVAGFADQSIIEGIGKARVTKYIQNLTMMARWIPVDLDEVKPEHIRTICRNVELSDYVDFTKAEFKIILRKFHRWLAGTEEYPDIVKWLKPRGKRISKVKMPEELITEQEILDMVKVVHNDRNKALIASLYETGCRIGELLPLKIKCFTKDDYGGILSVDGKTGPRKVRIISSLPYIEAWLNKHPDMENPEAPIWSKTTKERITYNQCLRIIREAGNKAGIRKRLYPHLFRHSRATHLAKNLTESQLKNYLGWVQGSDMAGVYVHMSGRDIDEKLLEINGIKPPEESEKPKSKLLPKICERCKYQNPFTNIYCSRCSYPLDKKALIKLLKHDIDEQRSKNLLKQMLQDEHFAKIFNLRMREVDRKRFREER